VKAYKTFFSIVLTFVIAIILFFFVFTDSYKLSMKARVKYFLGEYKIAQELAKEAFELDPYNKMAISILSQSKISVEFVKYIKESKEYLKDIEYITQKKNFSSRDKLKIKMICEVMLGAYKKLNPTVMTDKSLYEECTKYYNDFRKIYEEII
jgi:tetratricopeptide (TPR) repeat protein